MNTYSKYMVAITFAEAGEWDMAKNLIPQSKLNKISWFDKIFMSASFAEENCHDIALQIIDKQRKDIPVSKSFLELVGLSDINMVYVSMSIE